MDRIRVSNDDEGFGLVEIVVSLVISMIVFLALGALLLQALTEVADNGTRATAAQLATDRIESIRAAAVDGDWTAVEAAAAASQTVDDGRGVNLTVTSTIVRGACGVADPSADVGCVSVNVESSRASGTDSEVSLTAQVWVADAP